MNVGIVFAVAGAVSFSHCVKGFARVPQILTIENKGLSVKMIASTLRLDEGSGGDSRKPRRFR